MGQAKRRKEERASGAGPAVAASQPRARADRRVIGIAVALIAVVIALYAQTGRHQLIALDDADYITYNDHVLTGLSGANVKWAFTESYAGFWIPLTWISYMVDIEIFGSPQRIILTNVILNALNAALLFLVLRRLTAQLWLSAIVSLLFAIHPLRVESVAWATERKDVLSAFFFFAMLWFYALYVERRRLAPYVAAVVCLAASLLAKPMMVTAPFVLLLLDVVPLRRRINGPILLEKVPFAVVVLIASIVTLNTQTIARSTLPMGARLANALISYAAYIGKTLWPVQLSPIYPFRFDPSPAIVAGSIALLIALTALAVAGRRLVPMAAMGWLWYLGTLVPVSGIVQVGKQSMADRFTYVPQIGLLIAIVWMADRIRRQRSLIGIAAVVAAVLAVLTFRQVSLWRDGVTLLQHAVAVTNGAPIARHFLGCELLLAQDYRRAVPELRAAVEADPDDDLYRARYGTALIQTGDLAGGRRELEHAVSLNDSNADALLELGHLALRANDRESALSLYERAHRARPDERTRAAIAEASGESGDTIERYRRSVALRPNDPEQHNSLAAALAQADRNEEALAAYREALRLDPNHYNANLNLGALLSRLDRTEEAVAHFAAARASHPDSPEPRIYLALGLAQLGRLGEAANEAEQALQMNATSANDLFTSAVRLPANPDNLAQWIAKLRSEAGTQ